MRARLRRWPWSRVCSPRPKATSEAHTAGRFRRWGLWYLCKGGGAIIEALATAGLTYLGWRFIIAESLSLGEYVAFMSYAGLLLAPLRSLVNTGGELQKSSVSMARLFEYVDLVPEHEAAPSSGVPTPIQGGFRLSNVTFAYDDAPALSISDLVHRTGRAHRYRGAFGVGQEHAAAPARAPRTPDERTVFGRYARRAVPPALPRPAGLPSATSRLLAGAGPAFGDPAREPAASAGRAAPPRRAYRGAPGVRLEREGGPPAPRDSTRRSRSRARLSRRVSGSAWLWPAPCSALSRPASASSSSTK